MNPQCQTLLTDVCLGPQRNLIAPLAYLVSAIVCGCLAISTNLVWLGKHRVPKLWLLLCALYLMAACNALLHVETEWVLWVRAVAREQNVYEFRRPIQATILLAFFLLISRGWRALHSSYDAMGLDSLILLGGCGTLVLHLLRYVSFHYTDSVLNFIWLNHSIASWIEFGSLGLVSAGTGLEILRRNGHIK
jgi:hypothetical protein